MPKNAEFLDDKLDEAASIREHINGVHWKKFAAIQAGFSALFGRPRWQMKLLSDLHYYEGGWPHPKSKGRLDSLTDHIGAAFSLFHAMGLASSINKLLLKKFGIEIRVVNPELLALPYDRAAFDSKEVRTMLRDSGVKVNSRMSQRTILSTMVNECNALQKVICQEADSIKIGIYGQVVRDGAELLEKRDFTHLVSMRLRRNRAAEKSPKLMTHASSIKDGITEFSECIDVAVKDITKTA